MAITGTQLRRPRWHLIYYLLAVFDILTVSGSLYLNHEIMAIYSGSVDVNQQWATRLTGFQKLGSLAIAVNAPGNDVFDTQDVEGELAKRDTALRAFRRQLELTSREITSNVPAAMAEPLLSEFSAIEGAMTAMTSEADLIFSHFRDNETVKAGRRMATMDRKYARVNIELAQAAEMVRVIQAGHFTVQIAEAAFLRKFEFIIAGFIVLMVGFVTLYGHKIAKEMKAAEAEKARNLVALEENERTLRDSEEKSRAIVDAAMDGIITIDGDGIVHSFNRAAEQIFGFSHQDVIGENVTMLMSESMGKNHQGYLSKLHVNGRLMIASQIREVMARRKDSTEFPIELSVTQMTIRGKSMFAGLIRDITVRKQAEKTLRDSEEQVRLLMNSTAEAIYGIDLEGNCTFANPACAKMLGYDSADDLLGKHMHDLIHHTRYDGTPYPTEECLIYRVFVRGEGTHVDGEVLWRRDKKSFPAEYWSHPIFQDGEVVGAVVTFLDITERWQAQEQLRQAQKMEAVGQLTGGVAHDFNNLLAIILGNLELLEDRLGSDDSSLQAIVRATERGADLTQQLLAFSRQQSLRPQVVDLGALVGAMGDLLRRTLGGTIEVDFTSEPGLWAAHVDSSQFENAILNLALNARDAMPGGGTLTIQVTNATLDADYVATHPGATPGDYAVLAVSDSGVGMSRYVLEHVFEPFFTTKKVGEGSGLGLSMVYGFAKQSGGYVTIHSEEGKGTAVKLYLPRTREEVECKATATMEDVPRGRGETVLVVEDDNDVRDLTILLLEALGYVVLEARDGKSALAVLHDTPGVHLLLTDMIMPGGMNGRDLANEAVRRDGGLKKLFMSGYTEVTDNLNGSVDMGADLLKKPFRKRDLATKVRSALDQTASRLIQPDMAPRGMASSSCP